MKDQIEGKGNDIKGRVKRQVGEWTGDSKLQVEGAVDQIKGKAQNAFGKVKDGAEHMKDDMKRAAHKMDRDIEKERSNESSPPRPKKDESAA